MPKNMRLRNKKIGKNFQITCAQYKKNTARIHVHEYDKNRKKYIKHIIGEFSQTPTNQKALSVYNSTKTVKDVNQLLRK